MTRISDVNRSLGHTRIAQRKVSSGDSIKGGAAIGKSREKKLLAYVNSKIGDLAFTEVESRTIALRAFLEAALLNEFGSKLLNDPQFSRLVDRVYGVIENDPNLQKASTPLSEKLMHKAE